MRTKVLAGKAFSPFRWLGERMVAWCARTPWRPVLVSQRASCGEVWSPLLEGYANLVCLLHPMGVYRPDGSVGPFVD
jgi:hypothetical protein